MEYYRRPVFVVAPEPSSLPNPNLVFKSDNSRVSRGATQDTPAYLKAPDPSCIPHPDVAFQSEESTMDPRTQDKENKPKSRFAFARQVQRPNRVTVSRTEFGAEPTIVVAGTWEPSKFKKTSASDFPSPAPTLADIQRMEPDLAHIEQMMRASDIDHCLLARVINASPQLMHTLVARSFCSKLTMNDGAPRRSEVVVPLKRLEANELPDGFPHPPTLADIQRMEPELPLVQQLLRASDVDRGYVEAVLTKERKSRHVVGPRATTMKNGVVIHQGPCMARAQAQFVATEIYMAATCGGRDTWSFATSAAFRPCVVAVQEIIQLLANDYTSLIHGLIFALKLFTFFRLDEIALRLGTGHEFTVALVVQRIFAVAVYMAQKHNGDYADSWDADGFAQALGVDRRSLTGFELAFLNALDWRLEVSPHEWTSRLHQFTQHARELTPMFAFDSSRMMEKHMVLSFLAGQQLDVPPGIPLRANWPEGVPPLAELQGRREAFQVLLSGIHLPYGVLTKCGVVELASLSDR